MKIIGLDLSSKTGYSVIDNQNQLLSYGLIVPKNKPILIPRAEEYRYMDSAISIADQIRGIISKNKGIKYVIIEQVNLGKSRDAQKYLEFIHFATLEMLRGEYLEHSVYYCDSSRWRTELGIKLTKDQKDHNKTVKEKKKSAKNSGEKIHFGKGEGQIGWKHLSVNWVNSMFSLDFKVKDNDIADSICLAYFGQMRISQTGYGDSVDLDLEKIFGPKKS